MRTKGNIQLGLNFEPTGASILDARLLVSTKSDLIAPESYADKNVYKGMLVTVQDTAELYILIDPDNITNEGYSGWKRLDAGAATTIEIINDLTSGGTDKALSAEQGKVLKGLVDENTAKLVDINSTVGESITEAKSEIIGSDGDLSSSNTIKGSKKYADEKANEAKQSAISEAVSTAAEDAQLKADQALTDAKSYTNQKDQAQTEALTSHTENTSNPHNVTKDQVGLGNVTNDAQVKRSEMGVANGVATLNENGKVPVSQLDGQIARVFGIEKAVASQTALPPEAEEGERYYTIDTKKIYEKTSSGWDEGTTPKEDTIYNFRQSDVTGSTQRTNILYRWDGENLVEISASLALGETAGTAYEGSKGKQNADNIKTIQSKITEIDAYTVNGKKISQNPVIGAGDIQTTSHGSVDDAIDEVEDKLADVESTVGAAISEAVEAAKTGIDNYTVNGKKVSENPVLSASDINTTADGTVEAAIGKIRSEFAQADTTTLNNAKSYTDTEIGKVKVAKCNQYVKTATTGNSVTIEKATHACGANPMVSCYYDGSAVDCQIANVDGDITVSWNGSGVTSGKPLTIIIVGISE